MDSMLTYNPRPIFELLATSLEKAINTKDWTKVEELCKQLKKLSIE
jgi:hypothetical protein